MRVFPCFFGSLLVLCPALGEAQSAAPAPLTIGSVIVTGSLRTRVEAWNWFDGAADGEYAYSGTIARLGLRQSRSRVDWQFEFGAPLLAGLPDDAVAPGAQGQFGLGASYYASNNNRHNAAQVFVKQGLVRFKNLGGRAGQTLAVGRFEFSDGAEVTPANATLAAVKRERVAQRLLGPFGFSHVGRSLDGMQYSSGGSRVNVTALVARPTRGVFQVDGWDELDINVFYGAITGHPPGKSPAAEWRVFALGYQDDRHSAIKTDNRSLPARRADTGTVRLATFGGHASGAVATKRGTVDLLFWGALQTGSWGTLSQRSGAFAAEAGWQPTVLARLRPWIRGGWDWGSGDRNQADDTHGTFFQVLPTPRVYARFPFFNMMNTSDAFAELVLRPSSRVNARFDVHALRLTAKEDLWYLGGGAFQPGTFGYTGRPSNGASALATLVDGGADMVLGPHATLGGYYGFANGGAVVSGTYPAGANASLGYVELTLRF